jgi:hypothetical protein
MFPTDRKKIRERIRGYERALERELKSGYGDDGYGKRFLLGPLYMLRIDDIDGALPAVSIRAATESTPSRDCGGRRYAAGSMVPKTLGEFRLNSYFPARLRSTST